jgi:hypothetical protein
MSDQFTKVTRENYFQRLGSSFGGMLFGIVLMVIASILLLWNEGRDVDAKQGLNAGGRAAISLTSTTPTPANEGKLVHITGQAIATAPVVDPELGASFSNTLSIVRKVEMFQWVQATSTSTKEKVGGTQETTTTYTYTKNWSETAQDSSTFGQPEGHANPEMPYVSNRLQANDAKIGGFALPMAILDQVSSETAVAPSAVPQGWLKVGTSLYKGTGTPEAPAVGDIRVTYMPLASGTVLSVMGKQAGSALEPWTSHNSNREILVAQQGMASAALMIEEQKAAENILTWVLRFLGLGLNVGAFALLMGPLRALGNVIPLVASIIGGGVGLIAFGLGGALSLVLIAVAWFTFRPLVSITLIVAAIGALYLFRSKRAAPASPATA